MCDPIAMTALREIVGEFCFAATMIVILWKTL